MITFCTKRKIANNFFGEKYKRTRRGTILNRIAWKLWQLERGVAEEGRNFVTNLKSMNYLGLTISFSNLWCEQLSCAKASPGRADFLFWTLQALQAALWPPDHDDHDGHDGDDDEDEQDDGDGGKDEEEDVDVSHPLTSSTTLTTRLTWVLVS